MEWLPATTLASPNQLLLLIRLSSLPAFPPYHVSHVCELQSPMDEGEGQFISCTGIVTSITNIEKYTESACYYCPNSSCTSDPHIRYHSVGSYEYNTINDNLKCHYCGLILIEDVKQRILSDKLLISLVPTDVLYPVSGSSYQGFTVILRDDLCSMVEIGGEYTVIGVAINNNSTNNGRITVDTVIEANNVYKTLNDSTNKQLSPNILQIFNGCQYSRWSFPAILAYYFASDVVPPGLYHRLKLIILLSLVACSEPRNRMIDVLLIIDNDSQYIARQLLTYSSTVTNNRSSAVTNNRSVIHTVNGGVHLNGTIRRDEGLEWIDAGSLILSKGGVCFIDNINSMKKDEKEQLQQVLESGYITIHSNRKSVSSSSLTVPLNCTLWLLCDSNLNTDHVMHKPLHELSGTCASKSLMDHSGLLLLVDSSDDYVDQIMSTHLINKVTRDRSLSTHPHPLLTNDEIIEILSFCSSIDVTIQSDAHQLLTSYYVASRRLRGSDTPLTALNTLISLSVSHAKLNLQTKATVNDSLLSILIYEQSLIHRYGHSALYIKPFLHFKEQDSINNFDHYMKEFSVQVHSFIDSHSSNVHIQTEE
ncbi:PREDICTED: MCM domain-containing protein 2-like [Amphimedon queenslandica]|uniref:MCM C-terminal AAA(+) ATPase domain-containing protein n=1 Tax=Amphimedon queenslandica TaxID=400682 RepID=A0A1X7TRX5_AMPQE|nr:PREDICTED: MCM domain-containing protein 2-like [Amphimedon queenslandica]|eukprot:XP_019858141.1 PREDICTED: MCM domain-containing protein 2-like [Amphimedon queenslandica]